MTERVVLELPSELADRVRIVAARTKRPFEEVLVDWIHRGGAERDIETLTDHELLTLCDREMAADQQEELSALLDRQREGQLSAADHPRLDELMRSYRHGLVRKAQAIHEATARGLRPRLG
jgi:hypothetical protein